MMKTLIMTKKSTHTLLHKRSITLSHTTLTTNIHTIPHERSITFIPYYPKKLIPNYMYYNERNMFNTFGECPTLTNIDGTLFSFVVVWYWPICLLVIYSTTICKLVDRNVDVRVDLNESASYQLHAFLSQWRCHNDDRFTWWFIITEMIAGNCFASVVK